MTLCSKNQMFLIVLVFLPYKNESVEEKRRHKEEIVGQVPLTLSRIFHLILNHGGRISVTVTDKRIGLGIPATYTFQHKKRPVIFRLTIKGQGG